MCPSQKEGGFMKLSLFKRILDQASDFLFDMNLHHRGESLLHPEIFEMIRSCASSGVYSNLHTNATLLERKKAGALLESGLNFLSFSFDGIDAPTYEKIRVGASFEKTMDNIIGFLALKKEMKRSLPYTMIEIMRLFPVDPTALRAFRNRFQGLPLDRVRTKLPHNWAGLYDGPGEKWSTCGPSAPGKRVACGFPWYSLVILWDGRVTACPQEVTGKLVVGDVNRESLRNVWEGDALNDLRKSLLEGKALETEPCRSCDRWRRPRFLGIPLEGVRSFLRENLFRP